ncbi:MAG: ATP-dependent 6-phosphofructokinase [Bryobacter sp.]|nr:ATP-dependent 6-phosphofructokinase [Bryobacter sp.]
MSERIGILTGGGDCPGLNAVIRAVVKAASYRGWETYGFNGGFEGLLEPMSYRKLEWKEMGALLYRGGTVLGTTNKGRFSAKTGHGESRGIDPEVLAAARRGFEALGLRALVCLGGDGTMSIAQQMQEAGVPVVGVPKTIDNDLDATIMTFGFETAVSCAVDALDRLHTTAESHNRVMVLEVMGRYAGWIAGMAGLAGGADLILIPEIPFTWEGVAKKVEEREAAGKHFTIVIVAEGARVRDGGFVTAGDAGEEREARLGGIGNLVAKEIEKRTGKEARACVLGHLQRGGAPSPWDRQLCTRFGVAAVEMIAHGQYGCMAALQASGIVAVPLPEAIGKLKTVPPEGELVRTARAIGMSFGDA